MMAQDNDELQNSLDSFPLSSETPIGAENSENDSNWFDGDRTKLLEITSLTRAIGRKQNVHTDEEFGALLLFLQTLHESEKLMILQTLSYQTQTLWTDRKCTCPFTTQQLCEIAKKLVSQTKLNTMEILFFANNSARSNNALLTTCLVSCASDESGGGDTYHALQICAVVSSAASHEWGGELARNHFPQMFGQRRFDGIAVEAVVNFLRLGNYSAAHRTVMEFDLMGEKSTRREETATIVWDYIRNLQSALGGFEMDAEGVLHSVPVVSVSLKKVHEMSIACAPNFSEEEVGLVIDAFVEQKVRPELAKHKETVQSSEILYENIRNLIDPAVDDLLQWNLIQFVPRIAQALRPGTPNQRLPAHLILDLCDRIQQRGFDLIAEYTELLWWLDLKQRRHALAEEIARAPIPR